MVQSIRFFEDSEVKKKKEKEKIKLTGLQSMLVSKHSPEVRVEQEWSIGGQGYEWTWLQL